MRRLSFQIPMLFTTAALLAGCSGNKESGDSTATTSTSTETGETGIAGPTAVWTEAFDTSATGALSGVWGNAPDDVWIVGGVTEQGEAYHYDGSTWSEVAVLEGVGLLVWVYGFATDDVWAVGVDGAGVHWDGTEWSVVNFGTTEDLWGVFGFSTDDIWIVGGDPNEGDPLIIRYAGTPVVPVAPEQNPRGAKSLFKVWGIEGAVHHRSDRHPAALGRRELAVRAGRRGQPGLREPVGHRHQPDRRVGGRGNGRIATWAAHPGHHRAHRNRRPQRHHDGLAHRSRRGRSQRLRGLFRPEHRHLTDEGFLTFDDIHAAWYDGAGTTWAVGGNFLEPFTGVAYSRRWRTDASVGTASRAGNGGRLRDRFQARPPVTPPSGDDGHGPSPPASRA